MALGVDHDGWLAVRLVRHLDGQEQELDLDEAQFGSLSEAHVCECRTQVLGVHLHARTAHVIVLPGGRIGRRLERSHREKVGNDGAEARCQARLRDEAQLEFADTNDVVAALHVPRGNVEQVGLVVVLHQLDDHSNVVGIVLDGNDTHYVGSILCVRILTVLVGQNQARVGIVHFHAIQVDRIHHGSLKKFHGSKVALDQTLQFQVRWFAMQKDDFHVDVLAILVEEVLEKVRYTFVRDMATNYDMSARTGQTPISTPTIASLTCLTFLPDSFGNCQHTWMDGPQAPLSRARAKRTRPGRPE